MNDLAIAYYRVSTGDQENSLGSQSTQVRHYAASRGLTLEDHHIFEDEEVSGGRPIAERPAGRRFIAAITAGVQDPARLGLKPQPVRHAIVTRIDRIGRTAIDLLNFWQLCEKHDVTLHVVSFGGEPINSQGLTGRILYLAISMFAEIELAMIRERTQDAMNRLAELGRITSGTIPYGADPVDHEGNPVEPISYTDYPEGTRFTPDPVDRRGRPVQPVEMFKWPEGTYLAENPEEARWLRAMKDKLDNGWTPGRIATWLNHQAVPTKAGLIGRWQTGNVKRVLTSKHAAKLLNTEPPDRGSASCSPTGKDAFHSVPEN